MKPRALVHCRAAARWGRAAVVHGLWLCCVLLAGPLNAQYVPERVPRAGEQRLNHLQFRSTHNSFERDNGFLDTVSIADQMDVYDISFIEFDLTWNTDYNDLYIQHDCSDGAGRALLDSYLQEINNTQRSQTGVTFIYFNRARIGPCFLYPAVDDTEIPSDWPTRLYNKFNAIWGSRVYTHGEHFDADKDNRRWPSIQELLRRGKNIVPIVDLTSGSYFFAADPGTTNSGFDKNTGDEDTPVGPGDLGDSFFARHFPSGGWICFEEIGDDGWQWALGHGYTFPASNCSARTSDRLHPPVPTYVCCPTGSVGTRGAIHSAFGSPTGVKDAVAMVQRHQAIKGASTIPIQIVAGTYQAPARITTAVRLMAIGGTARIQ